MRYYVETIDLQLFAEDRTEKATPRRREEARKKGQVVRSIELNSAVILLCTFLFLKICGSWMAIQVANFGNQIFSSFLLQEFDSKTINQLMLFTALAFFQVCIPVMAIAAGAGLAVNMMQVGFLFTAEPMSPKLERINPISGFKRIFSKRALVELVKSIVKVVMVGYLVYSTIRANITLFPLLIDMSICDAITEIGVLSSNIVLRIGLLLLLIAGLDYFFQYWEHEKSLRMTKKEIKDEYRQYEGDPLVKGKMRQLQRQISYNRMMQQVPEADVVITNPTHYAVALRYSPEESAAPVVLAKGVDSLALRIIEIARYHGVIIFEEPPLAQILYKTVDINQMIPVELYETVATVLAFVYKLRPKYAKRVGVN
ncbi:MAG: flagellar biosynthesis protein FlhB [Syntrophaceticus sp.]